MKKTNKTNECINVVVNANVAESVTNLCEVNYAVMSKAFNEILKQTRSLSQCVKVFDGLMGQALTVKDTTMTIGQWFAKAGVKLQRGKLTIKAVLDAWAFLDDDNQPMVWRNVACHTITEDPKDSERVYTYSPKKGWIAVARYQKVTVGANNWSAGVLLQGILQAAFAARTIEKGEESAKAFEDLKDLYTFDKRVNKGGMDNKARKVSKDLVTF